MKRISITDLRRNAKRFIKRIEKGERFILTRRGKPMARLEPIIDKTKDVDDPFYSIADLATKSGSLTNERIDEILYPN
jgi:prevent-host-death family protein